MPTEDDERLLRYVRAMADADDEDMYEWEREYGRRARAAIAIADAELAVLRSFYHNVIAQKSDAHQRELQRLQTGMLEDRL